MKNRTLKYHSFILMFLNSFIHLCHYVYSITLLSTILECCFLEFFTHYRWIIPTYPVLMPKITHLRLSWSWHVLYTISTAFPWAGRWPERCIKESGFPQFNVRSIFSLWCSNRSGGSTKHACGQRRSGPSTLHAAPQRHSDPSRSFLSHTRLGTGPGWA